MNRLNERVFVRVFEVFEVFKVFKFFKLFVRVVVFVFVSAKLVEN